MNPKALETHELIAIEEQACDVLQQTVPQSRLYQMTMRLQNILQLEMIRRGLFARDVARLRRKSQSPSIKAHETRGM